MKVIDNSWDHAEEVYGQGYDTAGNYHYYGTHTGHHVVKNNSKNTYTEQLAVLPPAKRHTCKFCEQHEKGDVLYECNGWDGGVSYDFIENIQYCPICGSELRG